MDVPNRRRHPPGDRRDAHQADHPGAGQGAADRPAGHARHGASLERRHLAPEPFREGASARPVSTSSRVTVPSRLPRTPTRPTGMRATARSMKASMMVRLVALPGDTGGWDVTRHSLLSARPLIASLSSHRSSAPEDPGDALSTLTSEAANLEPSGVGSGQSRPLWRGRCRQRRCRQRGSTRQPAVRWRRRLDGGSTDPRASGQASAGRMFRPMVVQRSWDRIS